MKEEQATLITETVTSAVEMAVQKRAAVPAASSLKVRSITSRKWAAAGGPQEIDKVIWPLLNTSMSVRAIEAQANTSTATVRRSRQRWNVANKHDSIPLSETHGKLTALAGYETDIGITERFS